MRNRFNIPDRKLRKRFNKASILADGSLNNFYSEEEIIVNQHLHKPK